MRQSQSTVVMPVSCDCFGMAPLSAVSSRPLVFLTASILSRQKHCSNAAPRPAVRELSHTPLSHKSVFVLKYTYVLNMVRRLFTGISKKGSIQ